MLQTRHRVLLIEDNVADGALVTRALGRSRESFDLKWARRLAEARTLLESTEFDAIVLDLGLPDSDARQTLPAVRGFAPAVPIVVLTGTADELFGLTAVGSGAQDYLLKSDMTNDKVLVRSIRHAIARFDVERDLTETRAQLLQSQRLESIGRLAGGVAHDLNNILTAIYAFGEPVLASLDPESQERQDMREVLFAARRAERLVAQLLAFSRRRTVAPQVVDLNELVSDVERLLARTLGEHVTLNIKPEPQLDPVELDPSAFEQVLINLAVNARDAMPKGGRLTIETGMTRLAADELEQRAGESEPGDYAYVAVSDTGIGMDAETREQIFEPFFTTKAPGHGTGLGLSTCYGIIKQAGGLITIYSEVGHGSTFKVLLPVTREQPRPREARTTGGLSHRGSESILLVEDDPQVRRLARRCLDRCGYIIEAAADGNEAFAICRQRKEPFDLLLTDVVMPQISGKRVARRVGQMFPTTKVLFMSGYTSDAVVQHGVLEPGIALLQKPFSPAKLSAQVRDVLDSDGFLASEVGVPQVLVISNEDGLAAELAPHLEKWALIPARVRDEALRALASEDLAAVVVDETFNALPIAEVTEHLRARDPMLADRVLSGREGTADDIVARLNALLGS